MRQRGMVLILSLIFLTVVSLLAMAAMRKGVLQEKWRGIIGESLQALQAAEAALRGLSVISKAELQGPSTTAKGLYEYGYGHGSAGIDHFMAQPQYQWPGAITREYFIERLPYAQSLNDNLAADEPQGERRLYPHHTARDMVCQMEFRAVAVNLHSR